MLKVCAPRLVALFMMGGLAAGLAPGQSASTGALAGTLKDPMGSPLPNANVSLTNFATNQTLMTTSDARGSYQFSLLPPGTYRVRFSLQGFRTAEMNSMVVSVSEDPILDVTLAPGDLDQVMACQCQIRASTSSSGTLVDEKTITAVPLNTRNFTQVLSMASGSAADVNNAGALGRGNQNVNVNGNTTAGSYTLDGAFSSNTVPNPDTISEFKIQTSQYDSGYGAMVPNTNLITKGGENEFHGDLWDFLRNDIFNANAFFRNATGQSKPNLKQNQFGATLGGKLKRDKLFFFGSYQGTRQTNGLDPTSIANLILPPLTNDRSAGALASQFCPANHILTSGPNAGKPDSRYLTFAGGKQLDCFNQNTAATAALNPIALRVLQARLPDGSYMIPVPQTILNSGSNAGLGFSSYSLPSTYHEHQYLLNTDYVVSPKNTFSLRGFFSTVDQYRSFGSPAGYPGAPIVPGPSTPQVLKGTDYVLSARLTSVLTKSVVNEARMTYTRSRSNTYGVDTPSAASFGITPADPLFPQPAEATVLGPLGTFRFFGNNGNDFYQVNTTYSWADNLSWVRGKHTIRGGGYFLDQSNRRGDVGAARGRMTFQTFNDFLVGLSAADNLSPLGRSNIQSIQANEGVGQNGEVEYRYRHYYGSAFVQDDFKVSARLTLNTGLRWEYIGPTFDTTGTVGNVWPELLSLMPIPPVSGTLIGNTVAANYNPDLLNPYTGKPFGPVPAGVLVRSSKSFYRNAAPLDTFAPRFGFAWQPFGTQGRVTARGGYGWFYQAPTFSGNAPGSQLFTSAPFAQGFTNTDASNNLSTLQSPFPATTLGFVLRTPTSQLSDRIAGPTYKIPKLQQWNLNLQFGLAKTLTLDLGYVGSYGSDLLLGRGLNQPVLASPANPVNCGYTGVATDCITTNTSQNAKLRAPFLGETPTALTDSAFIGRSWYHSFQGTLRKQLSHGLTFQAAYTLSKAENNTTVYNDQNNLDRSWSRANFDRTHRVITNFDYQLPALARGRGFASTMLSGWSLAGIIIVQSGTPMTLTDPTGGSVYGRAGVSTVTLCPNAGSLGLATSGSVQERLGHWINTSAICAPAAIGSDGSTAYGNAGLSILDGPGQVNSDFSLGKRTRVGGIREDAELAFRVEFYNALNHSQFANPGTTLGTANFGVITQTSVAPRLIQFGLKYLF